MLVRDSLDEQMEQLLTESPARALAREHATFDDAAGRAQRRIVLLGAGGLGRRALHGLRVAGVEPLAFADNNQARWGTEIDGVPVVSPAAAAERYRDSAVFVVTIWGAGSPHRFAHSRAQLQSLGCRAIVAFPSFLWRFPQGTLPHYAVDLPHRVLDQAADVRRAMRLWHDDASREEYVAQLRFRLLGDLDGLPHPVAHPQYFPDDVVRYLEGEVLVDCGAYDGDTIAAFAARHTLARAVALEPDPANLDRLRATLAALGLDDRVDVHGLAVGRDRGAAWIEMTGTAASTLHGDRPTGGGPTGAIEVPVVPLDELLAADTPTYLKMDIEGSEPDALAGARATIARARPVLAICAYHAQDHLWGIPLQMAEMTTGYRFFLRPHNEEGWDLVCYGVPEERLIDTVSEA